MKITNNGTSKYSFTMGGTRHSLGPAEHVDLNDRFGTEAEQLCKLAPFLTLDFEESAGSVSASKVDKTNGLTVTVDAAITNADLQALIAAAPEQSVFILPARIASYGDLTLSKRVTLMGTVGYKPTNVRVGAITWVPSQNLAVQNEIHLVNLMINSLTPANPCLKITGAKPFKAFVQNCFVYGDGQTAPLIQIQNTSALSSIHIIDCFVNADNNTAPAIETNCVWMEMVNGLVYSAKETVKVTGGLFHCSNTLLESSFVSGPAVQVDLGVFSIDGNQIRNTGTNGTGIFAKNGSQVALACGVGFDVKVGTGFCIDGETGAFIGYTEFKTFHIPTVNPRNTKVKAALQPSMIQFAVTPTFA